VACQTCHIPTYARNAADSTETEATEMHRTWVTATGTGPFHPEVTLQNDLIPSYRFWDGRNDNLNLGDIAVLDAATGRYPTSRLLGDIEGDGSKIWPFKVKTAEQPRVISTGGLLALDTSVYYATGDATAAIESGLGNMGLPVDEPYDWVITQAVQALNHQVAPASSALSCDDCHESTARMDLQGEMGYELKKSKSSLCRDCHGNKSASFRGVHDKHLRDKHYDCSRCHNFDRD